MVRIFLAMAIGLAAYATSQADELKDVLAQAAKHLREKDYAAAQAPLELALTLVPPKDTKQRVDIYRMLMSSYRLLPEPDKMAEAIEYIEENSDSAAERSRIARDFASFVHQRGKQQWAIDRYEKWLASDPEHPVALAVLSTLYLRVAGDKTERGIVLEEKLKTLNKQRATAKAERLAKDAANTPAAAASNWKDVAKAWLEAGNEEQAKLAVDRSRKASPETRTNLLAMFWREGLGDVLLALGEREEALKEYEAALALASSEALKRPIQMKIEKAKADQR